jgi:hypothetical protein
MAPIELALAAPTARRRAAYRLVTPAAALLLFAGLAVLWRWGPHPFYLSILKLFGFEPFRFPFLDIHAVLAAAQCQREGIDVYLLNPCDALGRVHVYSPLWLVLTPTFLGTAQTTPVGLGLDLMFILSLWLVIQPEGSAEALLMAAVALSPMTVYALERANCDLAIFLLIVAGCALDRAPRPWRLGCYALFLLAGLLKYYPLVLLLLLARERRRDALIGTALTILIAGGLAVLGHADLAKALANIPALSYFADSFSALNLPFGVAEAIFGPRPHPTAGLLLLSIAAALAIARTRRTARLLASADLDQNGWAGQCLLVGALLLNACFVAGQNVDYRGIYLVLAMPGLVRLYQLAAGGRALRRLLAWMIAALLFLAWEQPLRRIVHALAAPIPGDWLGLRLELLFWIGRELVWWWVIAGLAAIWVSHLLRTPIFGCGLPAFVGVRGRGGNWEVGGRRA